MTGVQTCALPISFTDEARTPFKERKGLTFKSSDGDYTGTGLYAAVSYDEGKTWPDRRLITPGGPERAAAPGTVSIALPAGGTDPEQIAE